MSSFAVTERVLDVQPHPDADRLDIVRPEGTLYVAISQKGSYVSGDSAIYVPEGALVPERVLRAAGFWDEEKGKGMLAGSGGDRVKAIRLRGIISQGILIQPQIARELASETPQGEDADWSDALGITKYMPPIPREMSGQVYHQPGLRSFTDIENFKNFPGVLTDELVVASEKLHGSCCILTLLRDDVDGEWNLHVASKGLASKGLALQESDANVYWRCARDYDIAKVLRGLAADLGAVSEITLFGETLGVQDLMYGLSGGAIALRAFDLRVDGNYVDGVNFYLIMDRVGVPTVPVLYEGPFDVAKIWEVASGKTQAMTADGKSHLREGVVVRPLIGRMDMTLGRVILKFVSDAYLTRGGNATELE